MTGFFLVGGIFVLMLALFLFLDYLFAGQRTSPRQGHRDSAMNCKYYIGDNGFADWGTCSACPSENVR